MFLEKLRFSSIFLYVPNRKKASSNIEYGTPSPLGKSEPKQWVIRAWLPPASAGG
jgi:hypothetical protein